MRAAGSQTHLNDAAHRWYSRLGTDRRNPSDTVPGVGHPLRSDYGSIATRVANDRRPARVCFGGRAIIQRDMNCRRSDSTGWRLRANARVVGGTRYRRRGEASHGCAATVCRILRGRERGLHGGGDLRIDVARIYINVQDGRKFLNIVLDVR